jgi:acyl carrier protein
MRLAAYVTPVPGEAPQSAALLEFLRRRLPDHMVPDTCLVLDRLPTTPTGKIDRKALPEPRFAAGPEEPRDDTDRAILAVWREVLDRPDLGIGDNFFDSGGHSLLVPQIVQRVNQALGVTLPLRSLFRSQTVQALADEVRASGTDCPRAGA